MTDVDEVRMTPDRTVQGFIVAAAAAIVVGGQVWGSREKAGRFISGLGHFENSLGRIPSRRQHYRRAE